MLFALSHLSAQKTCNFVPLRALPPPTIDECKYVAGYPYRKIFIKSTGVGKMLNLRPHSFQEGKVFIVSVPE